MFGLFKNKNDIFNNSPEVKKAFNELQLKTTSHVNLWHLDIADWSINQDDGNITFIAHDYDIMAVAPAQIIGSFNVRDSTWLWGHCNSSVEKKLNSSSLSLYNYCQKSKFKVSQKMKITERQAWELSALSCMLNCAQGVYRGPAGDAMVFIEFGTVKLSKIN
jgi:hypothetical protein